MKKEYDFTNAEQGRFYRPLEELDIPIYLDKEVKKFFFENIRYKDSNFSLNEIINSLIKKDIEISRKLLPEQKQHNPSLLVPR
ncbi:hypothetical protein [Desulfonema magnum]|uniref:Uncharacterized protein n=1 Tax=Desulfonema magnum TaxID=45655 RepID=A0A975BNE6_9BACT|nr:hypothetical protein [Desulfonema magnum]QTA88671.1 Uncharacterized protein dnm_047180 [Desulfonema magnum]